MTLLLQMESANPSGSGKDRAVQAMLNAFEDQGLLRPGMHIVEGTSGSTGIALAYQCRARGYHLHIVMPDDQAEEKRRILRTLGATVHVTHNCAIANKDHYVNRARRLAEELNGIFVNQFENLANMAVHYETTGPEIVQQLRAEGMDRKRPLDAFVMSSGTGGTISGISRHLKEVDPTIQVVLADPHGSSLYSKVAYNICYTQQQAERSQRRHRYDSIVEGVGLDRLTANFSAATIDSAYQVADQELLDVARWVLKYEGLMLGSSSALNIAAAVRHSLSMAPDSNLVTMVCDQGFRHMSRFWNPEYVGRYQLVWRSEDEIDNRVVLDLLHHQQEVLTQQQKQQTPSNNK